jgi:hypothetical protein
MTRERLCAYQRTLCAYQRTLWLGTTKAVVLGVAGV